MVSPQTDSRDSGTTIPSGMATPKRRPRSPRGARRVREAMAAAQCEVGLNCQPAAPPEFGGVDKL
jgi:hypothetical protein